MHRRLRPLVLLLPLAACSAPPPPSAGGRPAPAPVSAPGAAAGVDASLEEGGAAVGGDGSPAADATATDAGDAGSLADVELAELRSRVVHAPPTVAEVEALVAAGIPKPPDPRAARAHAALMGWSQDGVTLAFLAATDDALAARTHATQLATLLRSWVAYGTDFGDPKDGANYGNATLEVTWFLGNLARASTLAERTAADGGWTAADATAFATWAHAVASKYVEFAVFPAGLSNRKASQIETLMRVAALDGAAGEARIGALLGSLGQLLASGVTARGDMPEDSPRDKYHPQFFLASALQALALAGRHGHGLVAAGDASSDAGALAHLAAAIRYAAAENLSDAPPAEYPAIGDPHADHDIPFWPLGRAFLAAAGLPADPDVEANVAIEYAKPRGFVMQWGFPALAAARGL